MRVLYFIFSLNVLVLSGLLGSCVVDDFLNEIFCAFEKLEKIEWPGMVRGVTNAECFRFGRAKDFYH